MLFPHRLFYWLQGPFRAEAFFMSCQWQRDDTLRSSNASGLSKVLQMISFFHFILVVVSSIGLIHLGLLMLWACRSKILVCFLGTGGPCRFGIQMDPEHSWRFWIKEALLHLLRFVISPKLDPHWQHLILRPTTPLEASPQWCHWDLCRWLQHRRNFALLLVRSLALAPPQGKWHWKLKTQWKRNEMPAKVQKQLFSERMTCKYVWLWLIMYDYMDIMHKMQRILLTRCSSSLASLICARDSFGGAWMWQNLEPFIAGVPQGFPLRLVPMQFAGSDSSRASPWIPEQRSSSLVLVKLRAKPSESSLMGSAGDHPAPTPKKVCQRLGFKRKNCHRCFLGRITSRSMLKEKLRLRLEVSGFPLVLSLESQW